MISKSQFAEGVTRYISHEVMPNLSAGNTKILLAAILHRIKLDPDTISGLLDSSDLMKLVLAEDEDGMLDFDPMSDALKKAMKEYGGYKVDLQSGVGKVGTLLLGDMPCLTFDAEDVDILHAYVDGRR